MANSRSGCDWQLEKPAARLLCIAHAATVAVMALEAWVKTATPGEKFDLTEPPSEAFDSARRPRY